MGKYKKKKNGKKYSYVKKGQLITKNPNFKGIHYFTRTVNLQHEYIGAPVNVAYQTTAGATVAFDTGKVVINTPAAAPVTTAYFGFSYKFDISNLPHVTEFTGLFDQYMITKVVVSFIPYINGAVTQSNTLNNFAPILHYYIDHDDVAVPPVFTGGEAALDGFRQRNNYKHVQMFKPHSIVIKPKYVDEDGIVEAKNNWKDCSNMSLAHYGLKWIWEGATAAAVSQYFACRVETKYYLAFKGVH